MTAPCLTWPALVRPGRPCRSKRALPGRSLAPPGTTGRSRAGTAISASPLPGPLRAAADRAENSQENCAKKRRRKKGRHPHSDAGLFCSGQAAPKRDGLMAQIRLLPDPLPEEVSALISLFRLHRSSLRTRCCVHSPRWSGRRRTCPWKQS